MLAYRSSPYFEYFESELYPFFQKKEITLFLLNIRLIEKLMLLIDHSFDYEIIKPKTKQIVKLNSLISSKKEVKSEFEEYVQVFGNKFGFLPNLSILIFCLI